MTTETLSLALDDANGLFLDAAGNLAVTTGLDACLQNCRTAMLAQREEMIYAMDEGIPTRGTLWDQYRPSQFQTAAVTTIENVPGVLRVSDFELSRNGEDFIYTATVVTEWGKGTVSNG